MDKEPCGLLTRHLKESDMTEISIHFFTFHIDYDICNLAGTTHGNKQQSTNQGLRQMTVDLQPPNLTFQMYLFEIKNDIENNASAFTFF